MAAMITTDDNPFDPREDYPRWYAWDTQQGYNTCAYLARIVVLNDDMPQELQDFEVEKAIDEIVSIHANGIYRKLTLDPAA